jgi:hypothetical protein
MRQERGERFVRGRSGEPLLIANLLMNVCPECGQESMPLESARTVERALQGMMTPTGRFTTLVYEMA